MSPRMQKIIELRNNGLTYKQMCEELKISKGLLGLYIHILLKKKLIKRINKKEIKKRQSIALKYNVIDIEKAKELRDKGYSNKKISEILNISEVTIAKHLGQKDPKFLTRKQRIIIWLRQQNFTYEQIAKRLHVHPGTIGYAFYIMKKNDLIPKEF